jgi:endonuclease/exonuclease/phosphatase family metal-dependent hydrolase
LLARSPIADAEVLALPRAPDAELIEAADADHRWAGVTWAGAPPTTREARCALLATVDGLRVASTHFSHVGSGERQLQARALAAAGPDLVLGDLNSPLDEPAMDSFAAWTDAFAAVGVPIGDDRRRSTDDGWAIDQVLLRPGLAWHVERCEVVRASGVASDHYPVVADLRHSSHAPTGATGYPPAQ